MEFIDLKRQYNILEQNINDRILDVIRNGNFILGPEVSELEKKLVSYLDISYAVTCANGTDALMLALMALNLKINEVVLVPSFTFAATAEALAFLGGVPFFIDSNQESFNIDIQTLKTGYHDAIKQGLFPVGVITVDLFGLSCRHDEIKDFCLENKLWHISDAAQAFGAKYKGRFNSSYADITTTSFFPAKPLGCYGDGGAVFTNCVEYDEKIRSLRVHGKGIDKYDNIYIGMNSRLDTIHAGILLEKLKIYDQEIIGRNNVAWRYNEALLDAKDIKVPECTENYLSVWAQYTIRSCNRNALQSHLKNLGIPTMVYYPKPLHLQTAYIKFPRSTIMTSSEELSNEVLSLPMHPYLNEIELATVTDSIKEFTKIC